jgi:hypothetical protein
VYKHFRDGRVTVNVDARCELGLFFDAQGLVHYEFMPEGRTVNKEMYVEILSPPRCSGKGTAGNIGKQQLVSPAPQRTCTSIVGQKVPC